MARKKISSKRRFGIFRRDNFTCLYCGQQPPAVVLELDHLKPVSKGGSNEDHNLVTSCFDCNRGKSDTDIEAEVPTSIEDMVQQQSEKIAQLAAFNELLMETQHVRQKAVDRLATYWNETMGWSLDARQLASLRGFYKELDFGSIETAIDATCLRVSHRHSTHQFKYFCGVCWRMIKGDG